MTGESRHTVRASRSRQPGVPTRRFLGLVALLVLLVILAACGGAAVNSGGAPAAPAPVAPPGSAKPGSSSASSGSASSNTAPERMVVRNGRLTLEVKDVNAAVRTISQLAEANGGYVKSEQVYVTRQGDQDLPTGEMTIAVRADSYDKVVSSLSGLAIKVESENSTAQDVTDQYVDLDANLRNLQASEAQLLKLMDKAQTVNDIIAIQKELTTVRGQIQQLQAQKQLLDRQIALSTIQISLHPPAVEAVNQEWRPLRTAQEAWKSSIVTIRTFADVLISVVVFSWWLLPIAALGIYLYRRQRQSRPIGVPPGSLP